MAGEVILKSFPFDSMDVLNEESAQMEGDRQYEAEVFRKYFAKFLSNGVYFGHYKNYGENSMKVTVDTGLNIKVLPGAGLIEGTDFENEDEKIFVLDRPTNVTTRIDSVVVKMDSSLSIRNTQLYIKQGDGINPAPLQRDENVYEICIAQVTVRDNSNITLDNIKDTRLDKELCGIVNSLISVDGEELYQRFQTYINNLIENIVFKDKDNTINGDITVKSLKDINGNGLSENDFTNEYKKKLDGIAEGANKYVHPTTAGNKHIPSGGSSGKILGWASDGTAKWVDDKNTTYNNATQAANGLMSSSDKKKLDGIAEGANKYVHPTTAGNKHIPSGGSSGKILGWSSDGAAKWIDDKKNATQSVDGLMSATDKKKLDGIASGATKNTNDFTNTYKTKLDGIATGANKTVVENVLTSTSSSNALSANQGRILKASVDAKQKTITRGTANPSGGSNGDYYIQYF